MDEVRDWTRCVTRPGLFSRESVSQLQAYPPPVAHNTSLRSRRAMDATTRFRNRAPELDEEFYNALDPHLFGYGTDEVQGTTNNANSPTTTNTTDWGNVSV